jgi:hypothetical protein
MKDTSPEVDKRFQDMIMSVSGEMRFLMGVRMFEAARTMVLASMPPGLSAGEQKVFLLRRFYGSDLDEKRLSEIIASILHA